MSGTVIVTGARSPVAAHLARHLADAGHRVVLADTFALPMSRGTRRKARYAVLPPPVPDLGRYAEAWRRLLDEEEPALVLPSCEEVFHLAALRDLAGVPLPLFAPPLARLRRAHHKGLFALDALGLGADPPATRVIRCAAELPAAPDCAGSVLKPAWSRFGSRVVLDPAREGLSGVHPTPADPWLLQERVAGTEVCVTAVAHAGAVSAVQAYRPLWRAGLGAAVAFAPVRHEAVEAFVRGFCRRFSWTGQVAFDLMVDAAGRPRALECNPRPTTGIVFFRPGDGLAEAITQGREAVATERSATALPLAMATYGLAQALRERRLGAWRRDRQAAANLAAWPGDGALLASQLLAFAEIAARATIGRQGLRPASTADIEWNGTPFLCRGRDLGDGSAKGPPLTAPGLTAPGLTAPGLTAP